MEARISWSSDKGLKGTVRSGCQQKQGTRLAVYGLLLRAQVPQPARFSVPQFPHPQVGICFRMRPLGWSHPGCRWQLEKRSSFQSLRKGKRESGRTVFGFFYVLFGIALKVHSSSLAKSWEFAGRMPATGQTQSQPVGFNPASAGSGSGCSLIPATPAALPCCSKRCKTQGQAACTPSLQPASLLSYKLILSQADL